MASSEPKLGELLQAETATKVVQWNTMDPRNAAAKALGAYLSRVMFVVNGTTPKQFQLRRVHEEWPESFEKLEYPCAAITSSTEPREHTFQPFPLEETWNKFCPDSVLWKTAELAMDMQVDFWLTNKPEREAVAARLDDAFNPTEIRSGVLLAGPAEYWRLPVRVTLIDGTRVDNGPSAQNRDREYRARFRVEVDVVSLRTAVELTPVLGAVGDLG